MVDMARESLEWVFANLFGMQLVYNKLTLPKPTAPARKGRNIGEIKPSRDGDTRYGKDFTTPSPSIPISQHARIVPRVAPPELLLFRAKDQNGIGGTNSHWRVH